ncbi:Receptor-like cytosolic serine/threonine-protein kinase RBK2 [Linum perenne]
MGRKKKEVKKDVAESTSPVGVLEDYFRSEAEEEESSEASTNSPTLRRSNSKSTWNDIVHLFRTKSSKKHADKNPNPNPNPTPFTALKQQLSFRSFSFREQRFSSSVVPNFFSVDSSAAAAASNSFSSSSNFTLYELQFATDNFSPANLIGKGGYAEVYKGRLRNGKLVAIKRLTRGTPDEMTADFLSELGIMAHVKHPNTAKLIGYGVEGGMHLICDFGLAKWLPEHWTHHTVSKFEGTFGLTDVFAYGVLLLELVTGRRALDYKEQSLAKPLLKKNEIRELVDPALGNAYDARQANLMLVAAALCIQQSAIRRPFMPQVEQVLRGNVSCLKSTKKCKLPFFRRALREELLKAEEYQLSQRASTAFLN